MNYKIFTFLFLSFIYLNTSAYAQQDAAVIMKKAFSQAKKENKNVFLIFHASWCGWCKKMDQQINDECCKQAFNSNYVITHLVVQESKKNKHLENPGAANILKKYNGDSSGIPFWLIFNQNGKLLEDSFDSNGQNLGCPATKDEVNMFVQKLNESSQLSTSQLETIKNRFIRK